MTLKTWMIGMLVFMMSWVMSPDLLAGVDSSITMRPPPKAEETQAHSYAPSRWGEPPARVTSTQSTYAANVPEGGSRNPAGLKFENEIRSDDPNGSIKGVTQQTNHRRPKTFLQNNPTSLIPDRQKGIQEVGLIAGDLGYFPKTIFVNQDIPVRMFVTGSSKKTLCVILDAFQVRRQIQSMRVEEITFNPSSPGKYQFYCPVNGMVGTLVVRELGARSLAQDSSQKE